MRGLCARYAGVCERKVQKGMVAEVRLGAVVALDGPARSARTRP